MLNFQAVVLREKLKGYDDEIERRRALAFQYLELLGDSVKKKQGNTIYSQFCILHPERDAIKKALTNKGYHSQIYYPVPIHALPNVTDSVMIYRKKVLL